MKSKLNLNTLSLDLKELLQVLNDKSLIYFEYKLYIIQKDKYIN